MIIEKHFNIDPTLARELIDATTRMTNEKTGDNGFQATKVFLFEEYAVLHMQNIDVRNVDTPDTDLRHLQRLADTLLHLHAQDVRVLPILSCTSDGGSGYIIQQKAQGAELYDRNLTFDKDYVLARVAALSNAPQAQYDKLIADIITITEAGVLIDFMGKDNFFYHETLGFQFIDLNAHHDYEYGLTDQKPSAPLLAVWNGFLPCYYDTAPHYRDTVSTVLPALTATQRATLQAHNQRIFDKCKQALRHNHIPDAMINETITNERFLPQQQQQQVGLCTKQISP